MSDCALEGGSVEDVGILAVEVNPALSRLEVKLLGGSGLVVATSVDTVGLEVGLTLST